MIGSPRPLLLVACLAALFLAPALQPTLLAEESLPRVGSVARQPLVAATERLLDALTYVGAPLKPADEAKLRKVLASDLSDLETARQVEDLLDPYCIAAVHINPESRVKVQEGPAKKELVQQGWRTFLVKVHNEAGINPSLIVESPQAQPVYQKGHGARQSPQKEADLVTAAEAQLRFLDVALFAKQPLKPRLSGLGLEYRILQLYSRDAGPREATLSFHVGQGTQDLGFRGEVPILFQCQPAVKVTFEVRDVDGEPTMAAFEIYDALGRVYPNPARRLAPDFFFHNQIYREEGEHVFLPPGEYDIKVTRGPEYRVQQRKLTVAEDQPEQTARFELERWIHPAARHWYSGDHHVHAAGCAHYDSPTEGVMPVDMMRHILGEDLNVGCVLSWGPCWYTQKQHFEGKPSELSRPNYLMRYDVEVSGFPSSHAGHLCLLRLKEDDYPGTTRIEQWPSWTLPVLKWGQQQGGVVGYSHSGWGLILPDYGPNGQRIPITRQSALASSGRAADKLPDYAMPPFDGIGANEYIVTVTHDACDFISAVDTPAVWELNIWYHTLNCGYRARISGETDFPCIYGDRVGLGRIYVKLDDDEPLSFDNWMQGVKAGRSYCGDGMSHLMNFRVNDVAVGEPGSDGAISQLNLEAAQSVKVSAEVAALLEEEPREDIRQRRLDQKPYWHIERARSGNTRQVPVELVVNGEAVARKMIEADGNLETVEFDVPLQQSSWVALRIFPSAHTNPIFVEIADRPIRANKKSAKWCRRAVDVCWDSKQNLIHETERPAAKAAYDHARVAYDRIIRESGE
ncbi:CehA/McbA family metallohydrolase [Rubinisphaera margarita]|uniref:CehA/McbA family metallohydrolase n=1 Tax=Rubinisphaera margarita TaxID=2909586 RepID=UPI001EE8C7C4|nr:CehA/McbA family metallohydrolase [Rubinisphaera margarita]MCG6157758.1 CehA/McbA family metallohydrolase [Rubinisphaera margarita]